MAGQLGTQSQESPDELDGPSPRLVLHGRNETVTSTPRHMLRGDVEQQSLPTGQGRKQPARAVEFAPPLVSILITNHNYAHFVEEAIQSVTEQIYPNIECIVVDDCSTDNSAEVILEKLRSVDRPNFRFIQLGKNLGQMGAMIAALENASGVFVTFLDSDDFLLPDFVAEHVAAHLNTAYSAGVSASDTLQVDDRGNLLEGTFHTVAKRRTPDPNNPWRPIGEEFVPEVGDSVVYGTADRPELAYVDREISGWFGGACSAFMFRRDLLIHITPKDGSDIKICADYFFVYLAHYLSGTLVLSANLSCWRLHRQNNFSRNPVLGGPHTPGHFHQKADVERKIVDFVLEHFDQLGLQTSAHRLYTLVRSMRRRSEIYKIAQQSVGFRRIAEKGKPWRFWLKYGLIYRAIKKK